MSRKNEILDALIDIFRNQGVSSDFTMKELAQKVNIGKSTIYEYFSSKEDLLQEAICRVVDNGIEKIFGVVHDESMNFEDTFKQEMRSLLDIALNSRFVMALINPGFGRQMPGSFGEEISGKIKSVKEHYEERFRVIFIKASEEGLVKEENLIIKTLLISSLVTGSIIRIANFNTKLEVKDIEDYIDALHIASLKLLA